MENAKTFLQAVAADENLTKALSAVKTKEELIEFAARHGHVLTEQDVNDIAKIASAYAKQQSGEPLSDEELELVSGGSLFGALITIFGILGTAAALALIGVTTTIYGQPSSYSVYEANENP